MSSIAFRTEPPSSVKVSEDATSLVPRGVFAFIGAKNYSVSYINLNPSSNRSRRFTFPTPP
jgi:hypothetical protein